MNTPTPEPHEGMCHGPGCTRPGEVGPFCSEVCQTVWDRMYAGNFDTEAKVVPCSTMCGGSEAWMVRRPSGAWEMAGCVCHNPRPAALSGHLDSAPLVEMGGRELLIVGGDVSSIPAREGERPEEVEYERGAVRGLKEEKQ